MSKDLPIRDAAMDALCPGNRSDGENALNVILAKAQENIRRLDLAFKLTLMFSIVGAMVTGLFLILTDGRPEPRPLAWVLFVFSLAVSGLVFVVWQKLQHHALGRKILPDELIPAELKLLISEYATGQRRVYTSTGTVPRELFLSHWAVLLFSDRSEIRGWVRSATGHRVTKEVYAAGKIDDALIVNGDISAIMPVSETPELPSRSSSIETDAYASFRNLDRIPYKCLTDDQSENLNRNPDHQWIVGGSRAEYEMGRDKALEGEIPKAARWKAFILDGIRYELRQSGESRMLAFVMREIQSELRDAFGSDLTPNDKPSKSAIMKMISTGKHNAALRAHFVRSK